MVAVNNIGIGFLDGVLDYMIQLNSTYGSRSDILIAFLIESFISTYFDNSQGGAYPHVASSAPLFIFGIEYGWNLPSEDTLFLNQMESSRKTILQLALNDGQKVKRSKGQNKYSIQIMLPKIYLSLACMATMSLNFERFEKIGIQTMSCISLVVSNFNRD